MRYHAPAEYAVSWTRISVRITLYTPGTPRAMFIVLLSDLINLSFNDREEFSVRILLFRQPGEIY